MNMTIELSERGVRDGVTLIGAYHFLLAVASLLGTLAVFVYAILPGLSSGASGVAQSLFLPVLGVIIGFVLTVAYALTGIGLIQIRNSARMTAIFLSLFGIVVGLFSVMGGIVGSFNSMQPDWASVGMTGLILVCGYSILTFLDIITLVFLLNWRVRAVFYGEEWLAQASETMVPELEGRARGTIGELEQPEEY
jgi:hypothetical protein